MWSWKICLVALKCQRSISLKKCSFFVGVFKWRSAGGTPVCLILAYLEYFQGNSGLTWVKFPNMLCFLAEKYLNTIYYEASNCCMLFVPSQRKDCFMWTGSGAFLLSLWILWMFVFCLYSFIYIKCSCIFSSRCMHCGKKWKSN